MGHLRKQRLNRINDICQETEFKVDVNPKYFIASEERSVLWCPIFKAASATWIHFFFESDPNLTSEQRREIDDGTKKPLDLIESTRTNLKSPNDFNEYRMTFIVVRHPFNRLVSVFRDKLEQINQVDKDWFVRTIGKKMVTKYREKTLKRFGHDFFSKGNNLGAILPVKYQRPSSDLPTFWEFVQYVLDEGWNKADEHWKPAFYYCSICTINYDYVIKFEEMELEAPILQQLITKNSSLVEKLTGKHFNAKLPTLVVMTSSSHKNTLMFLMMRISNDW